MNSPLNQARREWVSCVMVVSAILAARINLPFAHGAMWFRRWSATPDAREIGPGESASRPPTPDGSVFGSEGSNRTAQGMLASAENRGKQICKFEHNSPAVWRNFFEAPPI